MAKEPYPFGYCFIEEHLPYPLFVRTLFRYVGFLRLVLHIIIKEQSFSGYSPMALYDLYIYIHAKAYKKHGKVNTPRFL